MKEATGNRTLLQLEITNKVFLNSLKEGAMAAVGVCFRVGGCYRVAGGCYSTRRRLLHWQ